MKRKDCYAFMRDNFLKPRLPEGEDIYDFSGWETGRAARFKGKQRIQEINEQEEIGEEKEQRDPQAEFKLEMARLRQKVREG